MSGERSGEAPIEGRAFVFGDDIDTDLLAPSAYLKGGVEALARHCLEAIEPGFAAAVRPGDVLVAGRNLGAGSSREQAAECLKVLGIGALVARSFARIFYRNALNLGLPALVCPEAGRIRAGEPLRVDPLGGRIERLESGEILTCEPLPAHLLEMVRDGGLIEHLRRRFAAHREEEAR